MFRFTVTAREQSGAARTGLLETAHGRVETPAFFPVATRAAVRGLPWSMVRELGAQAVLNNTYHLYLRPGSGLIRQLGGLHRFSGWPGPQFRCFLEKLDKFLMVPSCHWPYLLLLFYTIGF